MATPPRNANNSLESEITRDSSWDNSSSFIKTRRSFSRLHGFDMFVVVVAVNALLSTAGSPSFFHPFKNSRYDTRMTSSFPVVLNTQDENSPGESKTRVKSKQATPSSFGNPINTSSLELVYCCCSPPRFQLKRWSLEAVVWLVLLVLGGCSSSSIAVEGDKLRPNSQHSEHVCKGADVGRQEGHL